MTPPPIALLVGDRQRTLPVRPSSAKTSPPISPENTSSDAVAVTPPRRGVDERYFQMTFPLSASIAESQPFQLDFGSKWPKAALGSSEPVQALAGLPFRVSRRCSFTEEHQSTAVT